MGRDVYLDWGLLYYFSTDYFLCNHYAVPMPFYFLVNIYGLAVYQQM